MAEPLSLLASVLALVTLAQKTAKGCAKIRQFRDAPAEIQTLCNDVAHVEALLRGVRSLVENGRGDHDGPGGNLLHEEFLNILQQQLERANETLSKLDHLVNSRLLDGTGSFSNRITWLRERANVRVIQRELRSIRQDLHTALLLVNSSQSSRIEVEVEKISRGPSQISDSPPEWIGALTEQISQLGQMQSDTQSMVLALSVTSSQQSEPRLLEETDGDCETAISPPKHNTTVSAMARVPDRDSFSIRAPAGSGNAFCAKWCSCVCHDKHQLRVPRAMKYMFGLLSMGCSGLPAITPKCNEISCHRRSIPSINVTYHFPPWFLARVLSLSLQFSAFEGPKTSLSMPRMVDWSSKLWRFSSENNREGIQRLFSQGAASPWDVNAYGESALHHAATWRHFDLCAFLIDQGAQPLLENQYAKKPIDTAWEQVFLGSLTTKEETAVASLFDDPVYMETRGFTVLHKIVLGLIRKDLALELECSTADINKPDANGRTSLSWAAGRGDVGAVQMLLDAGADHSIADDSFISTLHYAAGHAACTKILLDSGADATAKELFSRTPLHVACYGNKQSDVLDFLLNAGASINETDDDGDPALAYSLMNKQSELTSCLLRRGADMEISNVRGITAIHHAVSSNSHPSLRLLLESGADYTVINKSGQTILHQAANLADTQTMDLLAEGRLHNIDVYRRDAAGKTAEDYLAARAEELTPELKESFDRLMMGLRVKA